MKDLRSSWYIRWGQVLCRCFLVQVYGIAKKAVSSGPMSKRSVEDHHVWRGILGQQD